MNKEDIDKIIEKHLESVPEDKKDKIKIAVCGLAAIFDLMAKDKEDINNGSV